MAKYLNVRRGKAHILTDLLLRSAVRSPKRHLESASSLSLFMVRQPIETDPDSNSVTLSLSLRLSASDEQSRPPI